jgi:hypothetical protein
VNRRERVLLGKIYGQLNDMGTLMPPNPADSLAVSINLRASVKMAKCLQMAVEHLSAGELEIAEDCIADAQAASAAASAQYERDTRHRDALRGSQR